jgi:hypothetical protein
MTSPTYRHGSDAARGGVDITISLTPAEAAALGNEPSHLADWFDTALWALGILRTGRNHRADGDEEVTSRTLYTVLTDLDHRLIPRIEGIRDAAVRRHHELGGSIGDLALAMDVKKSTAQSRRNVILTGRDRPTTWERWATQGGPLNGHAADEDE